MHLIIMIGINKLSQCVLYKLKYHSLQLLLCYDNNNKSHSQISLLFQLGNNTCAHLYQFQQLKYADNKCTNIKLS